MSNVSGKFHSYFVRIPYAGMIKDTPSGSFDCGIAPFGRSASAQDDKGKG
jgi:hypothetical protein